MSSQSLPLQGLLFFMQNFVHFWWPSTRKNSVPGMGWKSWKNKGCFGEGSDILWIEHMATQIPLESFKSLQKIDSMKLRAHSIFVWQTKYDRWGHHPIYLIRWVQEKTMQVPIIKISFSNCFVGGLWGSTQSGASWVCCRMDHCHQFAGGNSHLPVAGCAVMEGKVTDAA